MPAIVFYDGHLDREPTRLDLEWSEVAALLSAVPVVECSPCGDSAGRLTIDPRKPCGCAHETFAPAYAGVRCCGRHCPAKHGAAWSPVEIRGTRNNDNVVAVTVAVFDLDHVSDDALLALSERLDAHAYAVHSTHNHRPPDNGALRLVMPLSRPVLAKEWPAVLCAAIHALGIPADPACKDLSRLYFLPNRPAGTEELTDEHEGKPLDVDALLALSVPAPLPTPRDEAPEDDAPLEDLDTLRKCLVESRRRKASSTKEGDETRYHLLGCILKGTPVAGLTDPWNSTVHQAASLLAFVLPAGTSTDAAAELLRPCLVALDATDTTPKGVGFWLELSRNSFERAAERRAERDAKQDERNERLRANLAALIKPAIGTSPAPAPKPREPSTPNEPKPHSATAPPGTTDAPPDTSDAPLEDDDRWMVDLIMRADGKPAGNGNNIVHILKNHPDIRGTLRLNEVTQNLEIHGGPWVGTHLDDLPGVVTDWLARTLGISANENVVTSRLMRVGRLNSYDPIKEYLGGLVWDRKPRVDRWLVDLCEARTVDATGADVTEYVNTVGGYFLLGAVARAMSPGCQLDTVLVLEGEQGVKKTSALRILGGKWFCETTLVLGDKDTMMLAATTWMIELAELDSLKRSETSSQRAFLTRRDDTFRQPYGRTMGSAPRRCIFAGTTNDDEYLVDRTGNRRYHPVYLEVTDEVAMLARVSEARDQLWAEAVYRFRCYQEDMASGASLRFKWWFDRKEQAAANAQTNLRMADSAIDAKVAEWWFGMKPERRPAQVTTSDIAETVLKLPIEKLSTMRGIQTEIGLAVRAMGFRKARKIHNGRLTWLYEPTRALKEAQSTGHNAALRLIARASATVAPHQESVGA